MDLYNLDRKQYLKNQIKNAPKIAHQKSIHFNQKNQKYQKLIEKYFD
jgi:hypothetical protein